jgi:hypothetical protein
MKPTPLPPDPDWTDRVEYFLQQLTSWALIELPGKPVLSGLLSGLILLLPFLVLAVIFQQLHFGFLVHFLDGRLQP